METEKLKIIEKEIRDFIPSLRKYKNVLVEYPIKLNDVLKFIQRGDKYHANYHLDSLGNIMRFDVDGDLIDTNMWWDLDFVNLCDQRKNTISCIYSKTEHSKTKQCLK